MPGINRENHRMRIIGKRVDINYDKTRAFFESRGGKYREDHPYVTTMYQDHQPQLTDERNHAEIQKIMPFLQLNGDSRILDMGCGIGRWADAIDCEIKEYLGIDFSESLIQIAKERNTRSAFTFTQLSVCDFEGYFRMNHLRPFNRSIIAGVLMYLNDDDVEALFRLFSHILSLGAIVYIREPVGIADRLTLKDFYSEELAHDYHTIYRTADEYKQMLRKNAPDCTITESDFLFDRPVLNNRKETSQYYFLLKREQIK